MPWWCAMYERTVTLSLPARQRARRVVDRLVEAVARRAGPRAASRRRFAHAASGATISAIALAYGAIDEIVGEPALEAEPGTPNARYW